MDRGQGLQRDEDGRHERERQRQRLAALHGADEHSGGEGHERREHAAQREDRPPGGGERTIRLRQHGEELPLVARAEALDHGVAGSPAGDPTTPLARQPMTDRGARGA